MVFSRYMCTNVTGEFIIIKKNDDTEILHINHVTVYTKEMDPLRLNINPQRCNLDTCDVIMSNIFALWSKKDDQSSQNNAKAIGVLMPKLRENLLKNFSFVVSENDFRIHNSTSNACELLRYMTY